MFEELPVMMVGTGTQHVVVLTTGSQDKQELPLFEREVLEYIPPEIGHISARKSQENKKRKREEFENHKSEDEEEKLPTEDGKHAPVLPTPIEDKRL